MRVGDAPKARFKNLFYGAIFILWSKIRSIGIYQMGNQFPVFFSGVADAETEGAPIPQVYFSHVGFGGIGPGPESGAAIGF